MHNQRKHEVISVPWMSIIEWHFIRRQLFSADKDIQREAYERVLSWQSRLGYRCPVAIVCTINLIGAQLASKSREIDNLSLAKLYSLALLRSISLITDAIQPGGTAVPMHVLGNKLCIPEWIIEFRHEATHSVGTSSHQVAKKAVDFMINWLRREYWDTLDPKQTSRRIEEYVAECSDFKAGDDISSLLLSFQEEQFQVLMCRKKTSQKRHDILCNLKQRLKSEDVRSTFCSILVQDGYLIPTEEQISALNISEIVTDLNTTVQLDENIQLFWKPIYESVCERKLLPQLMLHLVKRLVITSQFSGDVTNKLTLGWIIAICSSVSEAEDKELIGKSVLSKQTLLSKDLGRDWHPVFIACATEVNHYTEAAFKILLQTIGAHLPHLVRQQLKALMDSCCKSIADEDYQPTIEPPSLDDVELTQAVENMEEIEKTDSSKLCTCNPSAWSFTNESICWELYPLGKLPGQPDDPNLLNLLTRDDGSSIHNIQPECETSSERSGDQMTISHKLNQQFQLTTPNQADLSNITRHIQRKNVNENKIIIL